MRLRVLWGLASSSTLSGIQGTITERGFLMKQVRLQPEAFELKSPLLNTGCIVSTICPHSFYVDPGEALHHQAVEGCKN
jgi:hypothetical protein